jgi:hypothetical protein
MGLTAQVIFIDETYVKAYSHIDGSVDSKDILPSIIQAQDSQIQPLLGTDLFNALKTKITADSVSGDYDTLLNDYVRMATLKWTLVHFYPYLQAKILNGTMGSRNVDSITALSQSEVANMIDIERTNAQFYSERLIAYLQNNNSLFTEYNSNSGADMNPETQTYSEGGLTISGSGGGGKLKNWNCCGW